LKPILSTACLLAGLLPLSILAEKPGVRIICVHALAEDSNVV
jgi:hypothetical protein